jgi:bis(5'-nucleosyl)-tetraphosphatase (symmetrical)
VLTFLMSLPQCQMVLGNHDIGWLRAYVLNKNDRRDFKTLSTHPQAASWFDFLSKQPFAIKKNFGLMVHASVAPQWHEEEVIQLSEWLSASLQQDPSSFFEHMTSPSFMQWTARLGEEEKRYLAIQIFTRSRYYTHRAELELTSTEAPENRTDLIPWYEIDRLIKQPIWFGHWAALKAREIEGAYHLDGGAVYGGDLIAVDAHTKERWTQRQVDQDV